MLKINNIEYIPLPDAAQVMNRNIDHVRRLARQGKLGESFKLGHNWMIDKIAAEKYVPGPQGFAAQPYIRTARRGIDRRGAQ